MAEAISVGEAAKRVIASLGVLFDRLLDSADQYAEALLELAPAVPPSQQPGQLVRVRSGVMEGHLGTVAEIRNQTHPIGVDIGEHRFWFRGEELEVFG